ncbi:SCO family protein [Martelella sp. AMO21009]
MAQATFRKRPTAIFSGFTHCPEVCETTLYELNDWLLAVDPMARRPIHFNGVQRARHNLARAGPGAIGIVYPYTATGAAIAGWGS